ncbi:glutamate receptor ionotropic, delta-1-like isoform X2 [Eriocheir sinensis]|uniref:glutamate receptor ionotropic, delta-1-like isoform X2 n=1 Tax=Eriocheir sinensis TaxID=95602 RepID=UPI0021C88B7B|nr:glutamate receptor ionotropic, delta-1-like isoform X2 [Eriocheir sinensis]
MRIGTALAAAPCIRLSIVNWIGLLHVRGNSKNFAASGTFLSLLQIIAEKMNTCLELVVPPDMLYGARLDNGSWTGMMAQLVSGEVDMTGVPMLVNPERSRVVEPGFPLMSDSMELAYMRPVQQADLSGFVKPFTLQVWGILLASLMAMMIELTTVQVVEARRSHGAASGLKYKSSPGELWWTASQWTIAVPLAQAWWREPRGARMRGLAGAWLLFSFVLCTVYRSNLKAMLILPRITFPFNSLEELTYTDIPCYTMKASVADEYIKNSEPGTVLHNLRRQMVVHSNVPLAINGFLTGKHAAITSYLSILALAQGKFEQRELPEGRWHRGPPAGEELSRSHTVHPEGQLASPVHEPQTLGARGLLRSVLALWRKRHRNCFHLPDGTLPPLTTFPRLAAA